MTDNKTREYIKDANGNWVPNARLDDVPTKLSDLTDDLGTSPTHTHSQYLTSHQDITGKQDLIDSSNKLDADLVDDTSSINKFVSASDITNWNGKQDEIDSSHKLSADLVDDTNAINKFVTASDKTTWSGKQDALVSGANIKTINNISLLGSGDITISAGDALPSQTGHSGQFLTTDGTDVSWGNATQIIMRIY